MQSGLSIRVYINILVQVVCRSNPYYDYKSNEFHYGAITRYPAKSMEIYILRTMEDVCYEEN